MHLDKHQTNRWFRLSWITNMQTHKMKYQSKLAYTNKPTGSQEGSKNQDKYRSSLTRALTKMVRLLLEQEKKKERKDHQRFLRMGQALMATPVSLLTSTRMSLIPSSLLHIAWLNDTLFLRPPSILSRLLPSMNDSRDNSMSRSFNSSCRWRTNTHRAIGKKVKSVPRLAVAQEQETEYGSTSKKQQMVLIFIQATMRCLLINSEAVLV